MRPRFDLRSIPPGMTVRSTLIKALDALQGEIPETPFLFMDRDKILQKIQMIGQHLDQTEVYYAVKANPHPEILRLAAGEGLGFEVASEGELGMLEELNLPANRIISSHPMKTPRFLSVAVKKGLRLFAVDSRTEVVKIAEACPGANIYVRLAVPNEGSEWPLSRKFGVETDEALELFRYSEERGLKSTGITFHVGSQCSNPYNWDVALQKSAQLREAAGREGMDLKLLNIGGGYPIFYRRDVPDIASLERRINDTIRRLFPPDMRVMLEPGRAMVGDAGLFVTRVIGKERRLNENWLYLDVGVFNGLMEAVGGIRYTYLTSGRGPTRKWTVAGPSCDGFDVIDHDVDLPEPEVGELVILPGCGAYTICYASEFNGFRIPETVFI